jgi:hypothetical protein
MFGASEISERFWGRLKRGLKPTAKDKAHLIWLGFIRRVILGRLRFSGRRLNYSFYSQIFRILLAIPDAQAFFKITIVAP